MADLSGDEGSTTGLSGCGSSRTKPNCVRCRNHGHKEPLKGHKRYCRYKDCKCSKCNFTFDRQKTMAKQIALRRRNIQDELRKKQGLPVPSPSPPALQDNPDTPNSISSSSGFNSNTTNYPRSSCSNSNCNSNLSAVSSTSISSSTNVNNSLVSNPLNSPVTSNEVNNNNNNSEDNSNMNTQQVRLESIFQLLEKLEYRPEIDSLLYIILQQVNSDVQKAYQKILMAQAEIRPLRALLKPDYSQQLPCKPLPLPLPLMPLHQYSYFLKPAASLQPTYLPSNVLSIPRQGEMFPWEYIPKSDYKADLPINLHTSSTNFKEV